MAARREVRIRWVLDDHIAFGPGKADLLEAIAATGSISAAARQLGMSYRRAWSLAESMNACFRHPLIVAAKGGSGGGGASITDTARTVLLEYRETQHDLDILLASRKPAFARHIRKALPKLDKI